VPKWRVRHTPSQNWREESSTWRRACEVCVSMAAQNYGGWEFVFPVIFVGKPDAKNARRTTCLTYLILLDMVAYSSVENGQPESHTGEAGWFQVEIHAHFY